MNINQMLKWLIPPIFVLALVAALAGLWPGAGTPYTLTNFRGEEVTINARGLYYWDTVSSAAQMQANDLVTLLLGLPLLATSFWLTLRGSLRGRLLLTGTLGFILYTYITMCVGAAYNPLFLVYVALFSLSLFAFVLSMMSFDLKTLPAQFSPNLPRRGIAALLFFAGTFLLLAYGYEFPRVLPQATLPIVLLSALISIVNGIAEELLWRGVYASIFPDNPWWGYLYPTLGFAVWHFVPRQVFPNPRPGAAVSLVIAAGIVGLMWGWVAYRTRSIRWTSLSHILFDFSGLGGRLYF